MPTYDMTGTVKLVGDQQTFASGFTKREFVVTSDEENYPQDINFECVKEKTSLLDTIQEGQRVTVTFDLRGREYNGKYYVNLSAWKVSAAEDAGSRPGIPAGGNDDTPPLDQLEPPADDEDYPF